MYNESVKKYIDKWRSNNKEHNRAINNKASHKYYETHKEERHKKDLAKYYLKKEMAIFRSILIPG